MTITKCPSCGSDRIRQVHKDLAGNYKGQAYEVKGLDFHECPACGECVYDREAMRRIEAASPAFARLRRLRQPA